MRYFIRLHQQVREQEKELHRLKKENDLPEEASAFFAVSRLKSAKRKTANQRVISPFDAMRESLAESKYNDTCRHIRMYQTLALKQPGDIDIPDGHTVYHVMEELRISHPPGRKPNGITKADREARKSDDLLKRDFKAEEPPVRYMTDITEIKARNGKLYISAVFDKENRYTSQIYRDAIMRYKTEQEQRRRKMP